MADDTELLLKECNSGIKMGVAALSEVFPNIRSSDLKNLIKECKQKHEELGNSTHALLSELGVKDEEPNPMAKGMSMIKTNVKLGINDSDGTVADLITDGCNMGVKSLHKYLNKYAHADNRVKELTKKVIDVESQTCMQLQKYL